MMIFVCRNVFWSNTPNSFLRSHMFSIQCFNAYGEHAITALHWYHKSIMVFQRYHRITEATQMGGKIINQSINQSIHQGMNHILLITLMYALYSSVLLWTIVQFEHEPFYRSLFGNNLKFDSSIHFYESDPINLPSCRETIAYFAHTTLHPKYFIELFAAFESRQYGKVVGEMYPKTNQKNPQIPIELSDDPSQQVGNFTVVCVTNVKADLCWISHICIGLRI